MKRMFGWIGLTGLVMAASIPAMATSSLLKQAKKMALPGITNCQACHVSTRKSELKWNERGLWLKAKKKELNSRSVDVAWLKEYTPATH